MKAKTAKTAATQVAPSLAKAALRAVAKTTPAAWYATPRSLAEGRKLASPEPGSSAWLAGQREAREAREQAEIVEGSWAQPGRRAVWDDGLDRWDVTVTSRHYEGGAHLAEIEMTDGSDFGDWERLDVDVRDLAPKTTTGACSAHASEGGHPDDVCGWCARCLACEGGSWADHAHAACRS